MKLYLDTNIIYKYFDKLVEASKRRKSLDATIQLAPKKIIYLYNVRNKHRYFVSNLTRAEIFRYIHSGLGVVRKDCYELWNFFKKSLNVREISVLSVDFNRISDMLSREAASKGIVINLQHLTIAEGNGLTVLTGDKPLKERFMKFYKNVISYIELRRLD